MVAEKQFKGLIFMANRFKIGIDIRCGVNTKTIIVCDGVDTIPTHYDAMQMSGRSKRDIYCPTLRVYTTTGADSELKVQAEIMTEPLLPFKGGLKCLELIKENRHKIVKAWKKQKREGKPVTPLYWQREIREVRQYLDDLLK